MPGPEQLKHNSVSRLVWKHWLKTGMPLTRHEAREQFKKLGEDEPFKAFFIDGDLPGCDQVTYHTPAQVKGWVPSLASIRLQLQRVIFSVTLDGEDHDDFF